MNNLNLDISKVSILLLLCYLIYDTVIDYQHEEHTNFLHFESQLIMSVLIFIIYGWMILKGAKEKQRLLSTEKKLEDVKTELAVRLERQFNAWLLTKSEKGIAWLIIKGFSFAEIAVLRDVKENTVRQQAASIYAKSNVSNRSEFTASFLEDLISDPNGHAEKADTTVKN